MQRECVFVHTTKKWCDGQTSRYMAGCDPLVINTKLLILINLSHLFSLYCYLCHILDAYLGT